MTMFAAGPGLDLFQYSLVDNFFSMTVATMGAAALFFFLSRSEVAAKYRPALMVSGLVCTIAAYHYFMIRGSWQAAYQFESDSGGTGKYIASGKAFNDFYRYADWILTVPLLMVELVTVLALTKEVARPLLFRLVVAAALMIGLGYPGEISQDWTTRLVWGLLSSVPFFYILYVLWVELSASLDNQPAAARGLISTARLVLLVTWAVYPIAYAIHGDALDGAVPGLMKGKYEQSVVGIQVGYAVADILAKAGFGVLIYMIAVRKTEAMGPAERPDELRTNMAAATV